MQPLITNNLAGKKTEKVKNQLSVSDPVYKEIGSCLTTSKKG
jgi:hypothetical protein